MIPKPVDPSQFQRSKEGLDESTSKDHGCMSISNVGRMVNSSSCPERHPTKDARKSSFCLEIHRIHHLVRETMRFSLGLCQRPFLYRRSHPDVSTRFQIQQLSFAVADHLLGNSCLARCVQSFCCRIVYNLYHLVQFKDYDNC